MKKRLLRPNILLLAILCALPFAGTSAVAAPATLKEAAQAAVLKSPEVEARWHAFREASEEIGVAEGGLLPRVDLSAGVGRQRTSQDGNSATYSGNETSLTLRQMLFDGFATSNEVKRLGRAKLVRYFELLDASENTALEAARAYLDVMRYRDQVALAEDNYIQHQAAYEQLKERADSGVGRRVDVEQAASRQALADVNLTTAYANLHDVSARYLRIVGERPAKEMAAPATAELAKALPASADAALTDALQHNPALRASVENVEASQFELEAQRAAFMPRVDLVARRDDYSNYQDGGTRDDNRIELRLNFNLFNGGSDTARSRQYRERKNIALDQREKACRDMRQTLSIAYNETARLKDQLGFIGLQVQLVEKTRTAYRDQFNIGQRSLLDLLNTQNEYFDARRALVNAENDLTLAYLRSYAGTGHLLENLGLKKIDSEDGSTPAADDLTAIDLAQLCPAATPIDTTLNREELSRRAREMIASPTGNFIGARGNAGAVTAAAPQTAAKAAMAADTDWTTRVEQWRTAWAAKDVAAYLAFYSTDFKPEGAQSREDWAHSRSERIAAAGDIRLTVDNFAMSNDGPDSATTSFRQYYSAGNYSDSSEKTLSWRKENGQWRIVRELSQAVGAQ